MAIAVVIQDPQSVAFGGTSIDGVTNLSVNQAAPGDTPAADNETYPTHTVVGAIRTDFTISAQDVDAGITKATENTTGVTATFTVAGGSTASIAIAYATILSVAANAGKGAAGGATYSGVARSADGTTDPVSWTGA